MIVLVAKYHARPGNREMIERTLKEMGDLVREREPDCRTYQVNRSLDDPDVFLLYERYADKAALEAHRATPHFRDLIEGRIVPVLDSRERELYETVVD